MKILFLNYEFPPLGGGAGNATFYLLKEYAKISDLEVDLITSSVDDKYRAEKIGENITAHFLPIGKNAENLHFQSQKDLLMYAWKAYWFSCKLARQHKYDLSQAFFTLPCGFIALLLKWQFSIPYVVSLRGSDVPDYNPRFASLYAVLKPLIRLIWANSAAVVSNSQGLKKLALRTNFKQAIGVIGNGIDTAVFAPDETKRPADKFILTVGASRITARKGIQYLLAAVAKIKDKYPQIFLKLLGEGDEKENLMHLTKELDLEKNVEFVGRVARENTAPYYQEASLFVLPSFNEGMSNAMLEALASGLPLLATETGGTAEILEDGQNGYWIKMQDSQDLAEKIERLINDDDLRRLMEKASRAKALEMSWEKVAGEYFKLYAEIKQARGER